jgi:DNA mismatch repair protein MutL
VGRFPITVIKITLPPEDIDINVHPAKLELKFTNEKFISTSVNRAITQALTTSPISQFRTNYEDNAHTTSNKPNIGLFRNPQIHKANVLSGLSAQSEEIRSTTSSFEFTESQTKMPFGMADSYSVIPIGQLKKTFILCEGPGGLLLIDQHAADERVQYEKVQSELSNSSAQSQPLLSSAVILTSISVSEQADQEKELLQSAGWDFDILGPTNILLRSIPAYLGGKDPIQSFMACLDDLSQEERLSKPNALAATIACHSAIRAGDILDRYTMQALIKNLTQSAQPFTCAHGRPTMIEFDQGTIEKEFMR